MRKEPVRRQADERATLEALARETDTAVNVVQAIYTEELHALEKSATVRTFVPLLAIKQTRLILQRLGVADAHRIQGIH